MAAVASRDEYLAFAALRALRDHHTPAERNRTSDMAPRATMKHERLVELGAERLAKLVLDEASQNAPFKWIVAAALAVAKGPDAVAAIVDRRLAALERARGFVDYDRRKAFVADLASVVLVITGELADAHPGIAADRMIRFLAGADRVLDRVDDSSGAVQALYEEAGTALATLIARTTGGERRRLVEMLVPRLLADTAGFVGIALVELVPSLDAAERRLLDEACRKAMPAQEVRSYDWKDMTRRAALQNARKALADAAGDVDAFITLEADRSPASRDSLGIAERLLRAGRLAEALAEVRRPPAHRLGSKSRDDLSDLYAHVDVFERRRVELEIAILSAMGDGAGAQSLRLSTFRDHLEAPMLRDYVAKLPDFEDDEALDQAFAHAAAHPKRSASFSIGRASTSPRSSSSIIPRLGTAASMMSWRGLPRPWRRPIRRPLRSFIEH